MRKSKLAIDGGKPVRAHYLPYGRQMIDDEDIESVVKVLQSDYLTSGPAIEQFEAEIAAFTGAKYAVAFSSGTAALHGACYAAGIGEGDEVITTPMTFAATANCVLYQGAYRYSPISIRGRITLIRSESERELRPEQKRLFPSTSPASRHSLMRSCRLPGSII